MQDRQQMNDHDLLIRIDERMESVQSHLDKINGRLNDGDEQLADHNASIKVLKDRWKWVKWALPVGGAGGATGLGALLKSIFGG